MKLIMGTSRRHAHSREMLGLLGLPSGAKLPAEGMHPRLIQGIKVWVTPLIGISKRKRSTHRVLAECPECGKHLSAGRLFQHKCPRPS